MKSINYALLGDESIAKDKIGENQMFLVNIGLQIRAAKIVSLNPTKLSLSKPAVFDKNDICVMLKPESQSIRIVAVVQ